MIHVGILTVCSTNNEAAEAFAPAALAVISDGLPPDAFEIFLRVSAPEDEGEIALQLLAMCDAGCDVVLTTGGIGFAPGDVTPEATVSVLDRNAPGIAELLRAEGLQSFPHAAALNRGVAGIHENTLIVNLPEAAPDVRDSLSRLLPLLPRAVAQLRGG